MFAFSELISILALMILTIRHRNMCWVSTFTCISSREKNLIPIIIFFLVLSATLPGLSCIPPRSAPTMETAMTALFLSGALCHLLVLMLGLSQGVHSVPVPTDLPMCTASEPAQYSLTFSGKWTRAAFPKQYPVYRPPAQWSNLIGEWAKQGCFVFYLYLSLQYEYKIWYPFNSKN